MEGWAPGRGVGMNVEENQPVIDAFVDAFNRRDWDRVEKLHTESVIYRTPDNPKPKKGGGSGPVCRLRLSFSGCSEPEGISIRQGRLGLCGVSLHGDTQGTSDVS